MEEDFYDTWEDNMYDIWVMDEFTGSQKTLHHMNQLLDGQPMMLKQKGSQYFKMHNIPMIIISNHAPNDAYKKAYMEGNPSFSAFKDRLTVVDFSSLEEGEFIDVVFNQ